VISHITTAFSCWPLAVGLLCDVSVMCVICSACCDVVDFWLPVELIRDSSRSIWIVFVEILPRMESNFFLLDALAALVC
jgi:hypothetical protein